MTTKKPRKTGQTKVVQSIAAGIAALPDPLERSLQVIGLLMLLVEPLKVVREIFFPHDHAAGFLAMLGGLALEHLLPMLVSLLGLTLLVPALGITALVWLERGALRVVKLIPGVKKGK